MSAFNIVRLKVKPGCEERFIDEHRKVDEEFAGMKRAALVKTGERSYCFVGEWDSMDDIVAAREQMVAILDRFRDTLEDQGGDLGVTDPVSGEVVVDIK
ncbi:hypothetical protein GCM10011352_07570 [Marinobacterium zhoushanense]|uniref:DUF718 domain-containing protein n=1 Tax=Marinobacterium zhoushanense TaxID=1679163 RepID=A0ABQ1K4Y9_9GAMM|nr:antibiotic biosynthesis monooxygenase [Marinobacterium zhoushanense]GGB84194.1 hypothetical protein GCM10011352_07570 [Marinobacterium zhoushanense]